jgi:hypothetical protein
LYSWSLALRNIERRLIAGPMRISRLSDPPAISPATAPPATDWSGCLWKLRAAAYPVTSMVPSTKLSPSASTPLIISRVSNVGTMPTRDR